MTVEAQKNPSYQGIESGSTNVPAGFEPVIELLESGIAEEVFPGAVLTIGKKGGIVLNIARGGKLSGAPKGEIPSAMETTTVFDVGTLTSLLVTTTLMMKFFEAGKFRLDERVSRLIQGIGVGKKSVTTIAQLLSHTSGLPSSAPLYDEVMRLNAGARLGILGSTGAKQHVYDQALEIPLKNDPGEKQLYSEVNFILLGELVEILSGLTLDRAFQRFVAGPLGLKSTSFIDITRLKRKGFKPVLELFAPAGNCDRRSRLICGEVFDLNAWAMGGVAGHAGLFTVASDIHSWAVEMLSALQGQSTFLKRDTIEQFAKSAQGSEPAQWLFGWETPTRENGLADGALSPSSIGMCGSTGCSVWIDPQSSVDIVLLTNASASGYLTKRFIALRSELHAAITKALG